jgi:hypothetical protein
MVRLTFVVSTVCYRMAIQVLRLVRGITRWCQHSYRNRFNDQIEDRAVNVDQFAILLKLLRLQFLTFISRSNYNSSKSYRYFHQSSTAVGMWLVLIQVHEMKPSGW